MASWATKWRSLPILVAGLTRPLSLGVANLLLHRQHQIQDLKGHRYCCAKSSDSKQVAITPACFPANTKILYLGLRIKITMQPQSQTKSCIECWRVESSRSIKSGRSTNRQPFPRRLLAQLTISNRHLRPRCVKVSSASNGLAPLWSRSFLH